jgi:hypothetical protein
VDEDPLLEARAYNRSVLFMVAVPYTLLAAGGIAAFCLHRSGRKKALAELPPGQTVSVT